MAGFAVPTFSFGGGAEAKTPQEAARLRQTTAALMARMSAPQNVGQGLSALGNAFVVRALNDRAAAGEDAGQAHAADLLKTLQGGSPSQADLVGAVSDPWVAANPGESAVAQTLLQRGMQQSDPAYQLDLETKRAQLDALKAKPVGPEQFDVLTPDEVTSLGLPPGSYQRGSLTHKVDPIGNGSGVTVNTGDNTGAFNKKGDELAATRMDGILTEGEAAPQTIGDLKTLASLGAQIDTGKGAQLTEALGPYAEALGVDIKGLPEMQAYKAITDRMAPQMRKPGSGASSDTDVRMFLSALPSLGRTPEGNQIILQTLTAIQKSKQAAAEIATKAFLPKDQGGISWQEAEKQIQSLPDPYEGFSSYSKQADAKNNAAKPTTDAEFEALPSGSLYIDPDDGNTYRKP